VDRRIITDKVIATHGLCRVLPLIFYQNDAAAKDVVGALVLFLKSTTVEVVSHERLGMSLKDCSGAIDRNAASSISRLRTDAT